MDLELIEPKAEQHEAVAAFFARQAGEVDFADEVYSPAKVHNVLALSAQGDWLRVAQNDQGAVIAFVHARLECQQEEKTLHLILMAVDPDARAMGLGRKIVLALQELAREQGCGQIKLQVSEENRKAIGLFEASGYRTYQRAMALTLYN